MSELRGSCILAIDPGKTGAIAFYDPRYPNRVTCHDIPVVAKVVDGRNLASIIRQMRPDQAIIEDLHSMPQQGVASTFTFGRAFGTAIGIVEGLGIPLAYVSPAKWKKAMGLDSDGEKSRRAALNLFTDVPELFARKLDHNRAEAALLALYHARQVRPAALI